MKRSSRRSAAPRPAALYMMLPCVALLLLPTASVTPPAANAGGDHVEFPQTGHSLGGRFRQYWESHGGLMQLGYPISDEFHEKSDLDGRMYLVQYFERAVFEYHPENRPPNDVLLSLLGYFRYRQKYSNGAPGQKPNGDPGAAYFPQTGKYIGGSFLSYWRKNGDVAQLGYPISDEFHEKSDLDGRMYLVQYFERAVFEYHPENRPPNDVLLSLLGALRLRQRTTSSSITPTPRAPSVPIFLPNLPDGQYIPLYPGTNPSDVKEIYEGSYASRRVSYSARADYHDVSAFYAAYLVQHGWTHIEGYEPVAKYNWTDSSARVPWHLTLTVATAPDYGDTAQVVLVYGRYPDISQLPLYPGAQEVSTSTGMVEEGGYAYTITQTTYVSRATYGDLQHFYTATLPPAGWVFRNDNRATAEVVSIESPSALHYVSGYPAGQGMTVSMNLAISAQAMSDTQIRVTLKLAATTFR